jgi:hypothetical protein
MFALAAAVLCGALTLAVSPARAGDRRKVCAETVYVRNYPQGRAFAQLYRGQSFEVYEYRQSGWARGFAYGHINTDRSPYASPYDRIWIPVSALCPR